MNKESWTVGRRWIGKAYAVFLTVQKLDSIKNLSKKKVKLYEKGIFFCLCATQLWNLLPQDSCEGQKN